MSYALRRLWLSVPLAGVAVCNTVSATPPSSWPPEWREMEVEAKWVVPTQADVDAVIAAYPDNSTQHGMKVNVRWNGIPRKFVDVYYDWPGAPLSVASHSLRARTQFSSRPTAASRDLPALKDACWSENWQRVQYKSTPVRHGAVWFRKESGDCRIRDRRNRGLCFPTSAKHVVEGTLPSKKCVKLTHAAREHLEADHPKLEGTPAELLTIEDYRYRIELLGDDNKPVMEISVDHVFSTDADGTTTPSFEVELEALPSEDSSTVSEAQLKRLFEVAALMEKRFTFLTPSTTSKGGNDVPDSSPR